ncbi:E3 ubiquitin ligase RNF121-like isoform X1 [Acropora muricata]|uniref:E3 ubiquitin ligase RNF121-like isoform X1 n=1 Tax=Acropora muricata TaxID=159855 RepID=UPI0010FCD751
MADENGEDTLVLMNKVKLANRNSSLPSSRSLSKEELWKLEHEKLHAKHKGHEAMHMEMVLILFSTLIVAQVLLVKWKKHYYKSFQAVTLVGMWLIPLYFNIKLQFWRMLSTWTLFSTLTGFIVYKSTRQPLSLTTPRLVYKWFLLVHKVTYALGIAGYMVVCLTLLGVNLMFRIRPDTAMEIGVTILFYGLYFGVLGRDFAEICADKIASKLGYTSKGGLPSRSLDSNICAVCGLELALQQGHDDDDPLEKTYKLSCGHLFHEFCIRGWCIVGKKQTCPYCKEKVDLKRMFCNPWERPHVLFGQLLDWIRYLVVWQPIIIVVVQIIIYLLGLE